MIFTKGRAVFVADTSVHEMPTSQELADIAVDLIGPAALEAHDYWADNLLSVRQASIAGGTTEINKNIVGEHVLGLPR